MSGRISYFLAAFALLHSLTWAQNLTVSATLYLTTGTSIPLPATPPLTNQTAPPVCDPTAPTCPACNGQTIADVSDSNYEVYCGAYISSSAISQQPTFITPIECLMACDGFFGCTGAYINGDGSCTLSIGPVFGTIELDGYIGFVSRGDTPKNPSSSTYNLNSTVLASSTKSSLQPLATGYGNATSAGTSSPSQQTPASYPYPNATSPSYPYPNATGTSPPYSYPNATGTQPSYPYPNATLPSYPTGNTTATGTLPRPTMSGRCSLDNLRCPLCNNQTITDNFGVSYTVVCDSVLESDSQYAFAEPLPAAYCLAQCDERNSTCLGAYWQDQECTLALGKLNGAFDNPGYIAFIPQRAVNATRPTPHPIGTAPGSLPVSTGLSWLNMSAYPTGTFTSARRTTTLGTGIATLTTTPISTITTTTAVNAPAPTCNPQSISCPECDGLRILDGLNATYRVQCNFAPTCAATLGFYGQWSLNVCMQRCDADPSCLAAIFNEGHCDFCQGSMEGSYVDDLDYLVLVPETPSPNATALSSALTTSATTTTTSALTTPTPAPTCNPTTPMCPECASTHLLSPTTSDAFTIHCYDAPACDSNIILNDLASWPECLDACAQDPLCHSATFQFGACNMCQVTDPATLSLSAAIRPSGAHWTPPGVVAGRAVVDFRSSAVASSGVAVESFTAVVPEASGPPVFFGGEGSATATRVVSTAPVTSELTQNGPTPTPQPEQGFGGFWGGRHGGGRHHGGRGGGWWEGRRPS